MLNPIPADPPFDAGYIFMAEPEAWGIKGSIF